MAHYTLDSLGATEWLLITILWVQYILEIQIEEPLLP